MNESFRDLTSITLRNLQVIIFNAERYYVPTLLSFFNFSVRNTNYACSNICNASYYALHIPVCIRTHTYACLRLISGISQFPAYLFSPIYVSVHTPHESSYKPALVHVLRAPTYKCFCIPLCVFSYLPPFICLIRDPPRLSFGL